MNNETRSLRRVALVTGGTRGIGFGVSQQLVANGFDVAVNGRRDEPDVSAALGELRSAGTKVIYCRGDIADGSSRQQILSTIQAKFGRLDVLVNNAGVAPHERTDLLDASQESFDRVIGINLRGPYFLTQLAARWMAEQKQADDNFVGIIINVSSVSATVVSTNRGDYCISKAGIAMATQLWAARLAEFGIGVYEIRPGLIRTDMTAGVGAKYDKLIEEGLTLEPRWGLPEDVGRAVASLARGDLSYATGNVLQIDGGLTMQRL